jgi:hypothetical protein
LNVGGSINGFPIFSTMKFWTASAILSGLKLFRIIIFWKEFSLLFHSPGIGVLWGSSASKISWNFLLFCMKN